MTRTIIAATLFLSGCGLFNASTPTEPVSAHHDAHDEDMAMADPDDEDPDLDEEEPTAIPPVDMPVTEEDEAELEAMADTGGAADQ